MNYIRTKAADIKKGDVILLEGMQQLESVMIVAEPDYDMDQVCLAYANENAHGHIFIDNNAEVQKML